MKVVLPYIDLRRIVRRIDNALTCNWFAIALHCAVRGHQWHEQRPCLRVIVTTCSWCGKYRGAKFDGAIPPCWRGRWGS